MLQSIASVIQALPPEEEIPPVLVSTLAISSAVSVVDVLLKAIVNPIVQKLAEALQSASTVRSMLTLSSLGMLTTRYSSQTKHAQQRYSSWRSSRAWRRD